MFAALVLSFALLQAFAFVPTAVGAPGDSCDKPGAGNEKKCETPPPTPPPPTPTPPPPTETPPPPTPEPTITPDPEGSPAPSQTPGPGDPTPSPSASPSPSPSPSQSPGPTTSPDPSPSPPPTSTPTAPPSEQPTSTPVATPPQVTEPPVMTLPPIETEPPVTLPPEPTPIQTQPPGGFQQPPPVAEPSYPGETAPLAPTETDDPRADAFPFGAPGGRGPETPILQALSDLDELAVDVADPKLGDVPEEAGHAFGLRIPLGGSIGSLAATAGRAVQEFAFPLTLAIAVLLFLLFQGELDRRDPKLAYAPVDSTKDMVSFE